MPPKIDENIGNFLLTQKSIHHEMPYDLIERIIHDSIKYVKDENINGRISNVVLNLNGKLVLAQVYVERLNGFAPTKNSIFGTTPTSHKVQVRFPFGLETMLGREEIFLPAGDFTKALQPFLDRTTVRDDVQRDFEPEQIVIGPGIKITHTADVISIACEPPAEYAESITFPYSKERGKGYDLFSMSIEGVIIESIEYYNLEDYNSRLKMAGVYPLFYSSGDKDKPRQGLVRHHTNYKGYTIHQKHFHESNSAGCSDRLKRYNDFIKQFNAQIINTAAGKRWELSTKKQPKSNPYVFDISIINGITLYAESGLPIIRLRDYQLELFNNCLQLIDLVDEQNQKRPGHPGLGGKINMGVGAGKTFFTFTLLQHLRYTMKTHPQRLMAPPFCIAPDEAVAEVTATSINRQGTSTGISAIAISKAEQMPNRQFIRLYDTLTKQAKIDAAAVNKFIQEDLQGKIIRYCQEKNLHPVHVINLLYGKYKDLERTIRIGTLKDSIDVKRILLLAEAQKTLINKTGMMGITALKSLLEQFTALKEGIETEKTANNNLLFKDAATVCVGIESPKIDYSQDVNLPESMDPTKKKKIKVTEITDTLLSELLDQRYTNKTTQKRNLRAIRDELMHMACLHNKESAILVANSGGLGSTSTEEQLKVQINNFLPIAAKQLTTLAKQPTHTLREHYTLGLYLSKLFSTIPDQINIYKQVAERDKFTQYIYVESLKDSIDLVDSIHKSIQDKINSLKTVDQISAADQEALQRYGIPKTANFIEAANQLAGLASLEITGRAAEDNAKLLLSHIPAFTPEGLACYFEHLAALVGKSKVVFKEEHGIYSLEEQSKKVSKKDVADRLQQIVNAVMIADEVHKKEFQFLYDKNNPVYHRIDLITKEFLGKAFIDVLPHRIGMSGTMNNIAEQAFGKRTIYNLSIQKMIEQGLTKHLGIDSAAISNAPFAKLSTAQKKQKYAKQMVVDYFIQNSNLSIKNILTEGNYAIDLFQVSKGIFFSKVPDPELNKYLVEYFNLLIKEDAADQDKVIQDDLFERINHKRDERAKLLQAKLAGKADLTQAEIEQITLFNRTATQPITVVGNKIINASSRENLEVTPLNVVTMREQHRNMMNNNLFALYLEYILSKSSAKKECSDIIGLQNNLFEKGVALLDIATIENDREVSTILTSIDGVDPKSISQDDLAQFINSRIKNHEGPRNQLKQQWLEFALTHKNNHRAFAEALATLKPPFPELITKDRAVFESGTVMAMIGSANERTGYSHEPLGIVIDAPAHIENLIAIDDFINQRDTATDIKPFFTALRALAEDTLSYDEQNQAGGRLLRTPYGHGKYVQYQTTINAFIAQKRNASNPALSALKLEAEFQDIFTSDEQRAQNERASITFNRAALLLIEQEYDNINSFYKAVRHHFRTELRSETTQKQYNQYLSERLPLFWTMKYASETALNYFKEPNDAVFDTIKLTVLPPSDNDDLESEVDDAATVLPEKVNNKRSLGQFKSVLPQSDNDDLESEADDAATVLPEKVNNKRSLEQFKNEFAALLKTLKNKTDSLVAKGSENSFFYDPEYKKVAISADNLYKKLDKAQTQFFIAPTIDNLQLFKKSCQDAIDEAQAEFANHRSLWGQLKGIIKAILGVLAALTIIPAAIVTLVTPKGYQRTFFENPTDSTAKLNDFAEGVQKLTDENEDLFPSQ